MMDTRPAMSDTRCREDRLRGRGEDGERKGVGRIDGEEVRDSEEETMKDSVVGVADKVRAEKDVGVRVGIIGDVLMNGWLCLGAHPFVAYPNSERGEYGGTDSACCIVSSSSGASQSKPLPIDVTAQLPTLAAL
jgi:hypothetical protein